MYWNGTEALFWYVRYYPVSVSLARKVMGVKVTKMILHKLEKSSWSSFSSSLALVKLFRYQ